MLRGISAAELLKRRSEDLQAKVNLVVAGKPAWGPWTWRPSVNVLVHRAAAHYEVDLDRMGSSAAILDWLLQLHGKSWTAPEDVGSLLGALDDIFDLRESRCADGMEREGGAWPWGPVAQLWVETTGRRIGDEVVGEDDASQAEPTP